MAAPSGTVKRNQTNNLNCNGNCCEYDLRGATPTHCPFGNIMTNRTNEVPTHVLDFLRGIAAVYVLINHTRGNFFMGGGRVVAEAGGTRTV